MQIADKHHCLENRDKGRGGVGGSLCVFSLMFSNVFNLRLVGFMDAEPTATKGDCIFLRNAFLGLQYSADKCLQGCFPNDTSDMEICSFSACLMAETIESASIWPCYHTREQ